MTVDGSIEVTTTSETEVNSAGIVPGDTINETINIKPNATAESLMRVKIEPNWVDVDNPDISNIKIVFGNVGCKGWKIDPKLFKDVWKVSKNMLMVALLFT